jgi:restriction system protein
MVRLGRNNVYAEELVRAGEVGVDFVGDVDLSPFLAPTPRPFHEAVDPIFRKRNPGKSRITVGLAVGNLWVATCGIYEGDIVISPTGDDRYAIGEIIGGYRYAPGTPAPHRRGVRWDRAQIARTDMGGQLKRSTVAAMTVFNLDAYAEEIELLRSGSVEVATPGTGSMTSEVAFQLEKQLEDFLVQNWSSTSLASEYSIYADENGTGQQYPADTGRIDILAISNDKKRLLVVELKRGRPSDDVVGQVLRYMGWVKRELLEPDQTVEGLIIALDDDLRVRNALSVIANVRFMTYRVKFDLTEVLV